jgi:hypothetical protein
MKTVTVVRIDFPKQVRTLTLSCGCKVTSNGPSIEPGHKVHWHTCPPSTMWGPNASETYQAS